MSSLLKDDTYRSITQPVSDPQIFKLKNSKFYSYAFRVTTQHEVKCYLENIKKQHPKARHWCYAWQMGVQPPFSKRAHDNGEPSNTAGAPILGQIQSFGLTNVLVIVVRYFGGVKLGVSGLITSYRTAAALCLEQAKISDFIVTDVLNLSFEYALTSEVMRVLKKHNFVVKSQYFSDKCSLDLEIPKSQTKAVKQIIDGIFGVKTTLL